VVGILPPDLSTTFLVAAILPLVLGFIVGLIVKRVLKLGIAIAALVIILILLGIVAPSQIIGPLMSMARSGGSLTSAVDRVAGFLPYSSVTFIVGLALGFLKG
jgi:uncharacterized membrane protein (Fun14 family)